MSGILNSAGAKSGEIDNVKTLSGETYAAPSSLSGITMTNATATTYTLGTLGIPSAGVWKVDITLRMGWHNFSGGYIRIGLSGAVSGSTNERMVLENPSNIQANGNIGQSHWYLIDVKTGNSFNYTITLNCRNANGDSDTVFHVTDSNGVPTMMATKLRDTTTAGTGMLQL